MSFLNEINDLKKPKPINNKSSYEILTPTLPVKMVLSNKKKPRWYPPNTCVGTRTKGLWKTNN